MHLLTDWLENDAKDCGLCDPPMKADLAIEFLKNYLLGENWYVTMPESGEQCNTAIVAEILYIYSHKFRKELKEYRKKKRRKSSNGRL